MVAVLAAISGASAIVVGWLLARTWFRHGGASGRSHFRPAQVFGHATVGVLGVLALIVHLATGLDRRWGWTAVCLLIVAGILGATMFIPWWRRGRRGHYGDNDPIGFYPAEDHFTMRRVQTHGGLADLTWILVLVMLLVG